MRIALYEPITPGNIGAVARVMKNFGFNELLLIRPNCNHLSEEAYQRACHAKELLNKALIISEEELFKQFVIGTTAKAFTRKAHRQAVTPEQLNFIPKNSVILFGREDNGLPNKVLSKCDAVVTIPTRTNYKSINLSHAVAIILYELTKIKPRLTASKELRQHLINNLILIAEETDRKKSISGFIRNVINRSIIYEKEAKALIGLMKAIMKKIK